MSIKTQNNTKIYLDHAATTPIDPRVVKAMMPYLENNYGNASSQHSFGQEAMRGVNKARKQVADFLNCLIEEVVFTSGATESNNLAIMGYARYIKTSLQPSLQSKGSLTPPLRACHELVAGRGRVGGFTPHIITSQIEHPAVFAVCQALEREGVEISFVGVNKEGIVNVDEIKKAIKENTVLVSIMYVNNETGIIQPIREIGKMIEKRNKLLINTPLTPLQRGKKRVIFHTDATQAVNYCNCNTAYLHVDMLSLSGHKIYGPKGIGALYIKKGISIEPLIYGGHQENGIRSGTYNTAGIVGLGKAIELLSKKENEKILKFRDKIVKEITKKLPRVFVNGSMENRILSNINFSFEDVDGESVMIMLDMEGIAVSTGSACASGSHNTSHVLSAMDIPARLAGGNIRITLGKYNTSKEVDYFIKKLVEIVNKLRGISGKNSKSQ